MYISTCIQQILVLFFTLTLTLGQCQHNTEIELALLRKLETGATANVIVSFFTGTQEVLDAIADIRFPTREDLLIALNSALELNAQQTQSNVTEFLDQFRGVIYQSFWITNQLFMQDADITIIEAVAQFNEVQSIIEDPQASITAFQPTPSKVFYGRNSPLAWGITKIQAPEANIYLKNLSDSGVITVASVRVATIDTGARHTHEVLRDNYMNDGFSWYDPVEKTPIPFDNIGHGTHVLGTICGKDGIGVYPDAKWMACKGCRTMSCTFSDLVACGQWVACPTSPDGVVKDCTKAPHVVSNSWSFLRGNPLFDAMIEAWHVAHIIPVFSIGNDDFCNTAKSPGDRHVIGVGATSIDDAISFFSSKGPSADGKTKPDVVAPGSVVYSAHHGADDAYVAMSGTSMAAPHTSGLISILLAYNPELLFDDVFSILSGGTDRDILWDGLFCEVGGTPGDEFPNHIFGHGRINALKSLQLLNEQQQHQSCDD